MMKPASFEEALLQVADETKRGHIVDVLDTAELVEKWFRGRSIAATAGDICAMTASIVNLMGSRERNDIVSDLADSAARIASSMEVIEEAVDHNDGRAFIRTLGLGGDR